MVRDQRDPKLLGQALLEFRELHCSGPDHPSDCRLTRVHDWFENPDVAPVIPDYPDETTIEKYGDPRLLPHG